MSIHNYHTEPHQNNKNITLQEENHNDFGESSEIGARFLEPHSGGSKVLM
jgi:hypothetical protein